MQVRVAPEGLCKSDAETLNDEEKAQLRKDMDELSTKRNLTAEMCFINNERRKARAEDLSSRDRQESANEDRAAPAKWKKMVEVS